jgi:PAS domain S-box-containing protein
MANIKSIHPATTKQTRATRKRPQKANHQFLQKLTASWQNSRLKFKKVIDDAPLPILLTKGTEAKIDYVNPAWEKLTGYSLEEVKDKNPNILQSGKTSKATYRELWENLKLGRPYKTEGIFNIRKNGTIYQMSSTMFPVKILGKTIFYAQIEHDITQRKKKESYQNMYIKIAKIITESNTIAQAIPKILKYLCQTTKWELGELWLVNKEQKILQFSNSWNTSSLNLNELKKENKKITFAPGRGLPGRVWKSHKPTWILNTAQNVYFPNALLAAKLGLTTALAFPIIIDYQTIGVLTFFSTIAKEPDNELLKTMHSICNHLGQFIEHKRTEELLLKITRQNELILHTAGEGIYGIDTAGNATFINPAAAEMLEWEPQELIGKELHAIIHHTHADGKTPYQEADCPFFRLLKDQANSVTVIETFWRKNKTSFPVEAVATPIFDENKVKGVVVVFKDITERKRIEDMKKEFLSIAAHELKTPITTLKLLSQHQLAQNKKDRNQPANPNELKIMDKELDRLTRIINDILDDQRIETGKLNLNMENVDLSAIVDTTVNQIQTIAVQKIIYQRSKPILVLADADRIQQVLTNLLTNAIKYSLDNTTITVNIKKLKSTVVVSVKDQGRGIPLHKQDKIFDRFYQIQESNSPGFGLGLYISKQIIERHTGKIWVKSREGRGSTFYFSLNQIQ